MPPIPNSQFDTVFPAPIVPSIGEISQGISQEDVFIADSHPQNAYVNGFPDISSAKSESPEESRTQLHAIPESNNSSSRGSPLLGEDGLHHTDNSEAEEEEDPDEVTSPESGGESEDDDDDDDGRNENVSEIESESNQSSNSQEEQVSKPSRTSQGPPEQPSPGEVSAHVHEPQSALSTPQAFPSSGLKSSNVATESGVNLLGTKNVKRVLSFSPRPDTRHIAPDSTPKGNPVISTREAQKVVDRGSIYSISSGRQSRSPSEEVTPHHNDLGPIPKKAQSSSQQGGTVARLQRVEVPRPSSTTSQSEAWRPGISDHDGGQHRGSSDRDRRNAPAEAGIHKSASKRISKYWTEDEERLLLKAVREGRDYRDIAGNLLPYRTIEGCRKKFTSLLKNKPTAINSYGKKGTESVINNQDEENGTGDTSIQDSNISSVKKTLIVRNLAESRSASIERSNKQASNGKLSELRRQNVFSEAPLNSDNSKVNPFLVPDQVSFNSSEEEEDDDDHSDAGVTIVQENRNSSSNRKPVDKNNSETLPTSNSKPKASEASNSQMKSKQLYQQEKTKDGGPGFIQSQSSQNDASSNNHGRLAGINANLTSGRLQKVKVDKSNDSLSKNNVRIPFKYLICLII